MDKLYIIDGHNVLFRSYYAIRGMTNPQGESTNALYGFIRTVYKLMKEFSPNHLLIVFDGPNSKQSRVALYADYKIQRKKMPDDLFPQIQQAIEFCAIAGLPYLQIPNVEGDDTMGSVALWAAHKGTDVFLCSSDKDLCQLVSEHISLLQLHKDNLLVDEKKVEEIYGISPQQMVDYLAIVGDTSDNIPGIEGIGPKTAAELLQSFGSLDALLAHPEQVKGEKRQNQIKNSKEIALLSRKLATINTQVEFPKECDFFRLKTPDLERVKEFYTRMHFLSLLKEIDSQSLPSPAATEESSFDSILIDTPEEIDELFALLCKEKEICIDTETTDIKPMQARLVGVGLGSLAAKKAWYIPANGKLGKEALTAFLTKLIFTPGIAFYGHNIKYDLHALANEGVPIPRLCFDTMIASYLLHPQQQRHNLDQLSLEYFSFVKTPIEDLIGKGKEQISMDQVPIQTVSRYCCEDVIYTCKLKELFYAKLQKNQLLSLFETLELPLIPVLLRMERYGIYLETSELAQMSLELAHKLRTLEQKIYSLAGEEFNINSPKQLSALLFEKIAIHPPKKTTTGFSTAAPVLEKLQESHPIIREILEYRMLEKLRSTYVDSLPHEVLPKTHRIHCTFNQSVAATGRLSCQDPNLQNIPIRSAEGKKIRKAFKPQLPGWSYLSSDYSQIELRLLAHLCEDPFLIEAFQAGEDIHASTASMVFDVPLKEVTAEMRQRAKAVNFGILYGQQAFGLSQGLSIEYREAAAFIETYFKRFTRVKEFLEFCKEGVRKTGRAVTMLGRERPIPDINSKNPQIRSAAERLAINTPLQGTAADLIKLAMLQIDQLLLDRPRLGMMILQIHDELLFEVSDSQIDTLRPQVKNIMENVIVLKVPLTVDISVGKNWEEC